MELDGHVNPMIDPDDRSDVLPNVNMGQGLNVGHHNTQMDSVMAFFASTVATLGVILSQVEDLASMATQGSGTIRTEFENSSIMESSLSFMCRRRNATCMWYICVMYHFLMLHNQWRNPRQINLEWYIKPRSRQWFVLFLVTVPNIDPERFRQFFRISPALFMHICELVHEDLVTDPHEHFRILPNRVLQVQRQVGLALIRLCTGDTFLVVAELFGVSKSTAIKVTWKFVQALNRRAGHYIRWPDAPKFAEVKARFEERWGFPNCCGAVDGTHFPVELPAGESSFDYYDYKHNISVSMQAIVDLNLRFINVVAGWPGSIQDTRLMRNTKFFQHVVYRESRLNGAAVQDANGHHIREYILGDSGYPLYDWLITPFPRGMSQETDLWNHRHSSARMCVERAFGRLKGTWRILSRILFKPHLDRISSTIFCCCVLHNMIIDRHDGLNPAVYQGAAPHPTGYGDYARPNRAHFAGGQEARDRLLRTVLRNMEVDG